MRDLSPMTDRGVAHPLRPALLALSAWGAFFGLSAALSLSLGRRSSVSLVPMIETNITLAVVWAFLSVAIVTWHRRVRSSAANVWAVFGFHLPMFVIAAIIDTFVSRWTAQVFEHSQLRTAFVASLTFYLDFDIVSYVAVVAVAEALLVRRALLERQRLATRLESSLSRARLDYLEAQLQPHFLFNSLGAVSELAYDAPAVANRVLRQLIAIFRTALARKSDEVTLGEEIVGIEPYLDIQRIRFADWLTIEYHVDDAAVDCLLPRFILQPLVENAIRHGLSGRTSAGRIDISATVEAGALIVRVSDNGVGLDAAASSAGRGIGLTNVRDRLAILYGDDNRLALMSGARGGAVAELRVPARKRDETAVMVEASAPTISIAETDLRTLPMPRFFSRPVVAIPIAWFTCGLVWTQQSYVYETLRGRMGDRTWWMLARNDLTSAFVWAVLTPLVLFAARQWPLRREYFVFRGLAYLLAGGVVAITQIAALQWLTGRSGALFAPAWQMNYLVNFAIFFVLTAIGHRGVLVQWLRDREAASLALTTELAAAQARAAKLQAIPPVLVRSLDGIADTAKRDPDLTERQLTRLADYLRLALECTDEKGMTPDRERALESAVAALRESGAYSHDLTLSA
jgi:sensor histidine kinase YesM